MKHPLKYQTIRNDLRGKILDGSFTGGKLPPVSKLTREYGASQLTVNRAVKSLEAEGLVNCATGRGGTSLNRNALRQMEFEQSDSLSFPDEIKSRRRTSELRILETPGAALPERLGKILVQEFRELYPWIEPCFRGTPELDAEALSECDTAICTHAETIGLKGEMLDLSPYLRVFPDPAVFPADERFSRIITWNTPLIFTEKGLPPPHTWDDFVKTGLELHAANRDCVILAGPTTILHYFNGSLKKNLSREEIGKALAILKRLDFMHSIWNNSSIPLLRRKVLAGEAAMVFSYLNVFLEREPHAAECVCTLPPTASGSYLAASVRAFISRRTRSAKNAWLWIDFLRSDSVQERIAKEGCGAPASRSVFNGRFAADFPALRRCLEPALEHMEETSISSETRSWLYAKILPMFADYFKGAIPLEKAIEGFMFWTDKLLKLEEIE